MFAEAPTMARFPPRHAPSASDHHRIPIVATLRSQPAATAKASAMPPTIPTWITAAMSMNSPTARTIPTRRMRPARLGAAMSGSFDVPHPGRHRQAIAPYTTRARWRIGQGLASVGPLPSTRFRVRYARRVAALDGRPEVP
jgi:hypothetical protein